MTVNETIKELDKAIKEIEAAFPKLIRYAVAGGVPPPGTRAAIDLLALMKLRIQDRGINASGQKFRPYSKKPILVGRDIKRGGTVSLANNVWREMASSKRKRKGLKWVTVGGHKLFELKGGYEQAKSIFLGKTPDHVDFTLTGDLMRSIKVRNISGSGGVYTVTIAPASERERKKLEGLEDSRGDILDFSDSEIENVSVLIRDYIEKVIIRELGKKD